MHVLGIWDGHDAGAALLEGNNILFAINEERLSRRKLEVGFPDLSIKACLVHAGISPAAIREIALCTSDPAKTLTRLLPGLKEEYYLIRRRKKRPKMSDRFKKGFKYRFTEMGPNALSRGLSRSYVEKQLRTAGFRDFHLTFCDHHRCHAEAAVRLSGYNSCVAVTLDGVGDGLSGSIWQFKDSILQLVKEIPSRASLGIFFEHVTTLMNMRELEDEGKVMALANYAYPIADHKNPLMDLIGVQQMELISPYRSNRMYKELKRILWQYPSEQFAYMAQRVLEKNALALIRNAASFTGSRNVALAGGVFSNIKLNMKILEETKIDRAYVFPHMGDGGLAIGAGITLMNQRCPMEWRRFNDPYLGPGYSTEEILSALKKTRFSYKEIKDRAKTAARLILDGEIILWFQGRMEIGPRALGNRTIMARPDRRDIKDRLNLVLKKRVWYQPFCPSILREDASALLHTNGQNLDDNRFMTMGFKVRKEYMDLMEGVINVDGTCRPQFVGDENPVYRDLLKIVQKEVGKGVVLNTSLNIHGEPVVCSPDDALQMFEKTAVTFLFLEDFLVEKQSR